MPVQPVVGRFVRVVQTANVSVVDGAPRPQQMQRSAPDSNAVVVGQRVGGGVRHFSPMQSPVLPSVHAALLFWDDAADSAPQSA